MPAHLIPTHYLAQYTSPQHPASPLGEPNSTQPTPNSQAHWPVPNPSSSPNRLPPSRSRNQGEFAVAGREEEEGGGGARRGGRRRRRRKREGAEKRRGRWRWCYGSDEGEESSDSGIRPRKEKGDGRLWIRSEGRRGGCAVLGVDAREAEIHRFSERPPQEQGKRPSNAPTVEERKRWRRNQQRWETRMEPERKGSEIREEDEGAEKQEGERRWCYGSDTVEGNERKRPADEDGRRSREAMCVGLDRWKSRKSEGPRPAMMATKGEKNEGRGGGRCWLTTRDKRSERETTAVASAEEEAEERGLVGGEILGQQR